LTFFPWCWAGQMLQNPFHFNPLIPFEKQDLL
jgi:hypothetical protein